ncbi:hypothetical protein ACM66B_002698 [Microbotryomycetes sp. NB124-2]
MPVGPNAKARNTHKQSLIVLVPVKLSRNGRRTLRLPVLRSFLASSTFKRDDTLAPNKHRSTRLLPTLVKSLVTVLLCLTPAILLLVFALKYQRSTLVVSHAQLARIYAWEMAAGRHPSSEPIDSRLMAKLSTAGFDKFQNPGLPPSTRTRSVAATGHERQYLSPPSLTDKGWPPRPHNGATLDLDIVMKHCDFGSGKYVRDCLERLRVNAGLQAPSTRRGSKEVWSMHYVTRGGNRGGTRRSFTDESPKTLLEAPLAAFRSALYARQQHTKSKVPSINSDDVSSVPHQTHPTADAACDPDNPRLVHMFWTGEFTDKPYMAALSFLYTQNLGLDRSSSEASALPGVCRPQLWIWINPGAASSVPNPHAQAELEHAMKNNPWSSPLLHPKFEQHVKFRLWNTTEQLDGVERMQGWRDKPLFQSHGKKFKSSIQQGIQAHSPKNATRSSSSDSRTYDRLSVVLSDMARFVLTFRYGGIYIDADTLFLRDWTELFNYPGSFAYRWSRLPLYNTAVLKMQRGSMTGEWLFETAVENGNDFHPMTLSRYTRDAGMDGLIVRLPDALFDPPWLNVENYQRDRPAFPSFKSFEDFFSHPATNDIESGLPSSTLGFESFFRGAFSYHWHNFWWKPFDVDRNFPDLDRSKRFGETNVARDDHDDEDDHKDLSWSQVVKRTFESFVRGETPNMYGEWIHYET